MICVLKYEQSHVTGWIIAVDVNHASQQAQAIGELELAQVCSQMKDDPPRPGAYLIVYYEVEQIDPMDMSSVERGYVMLVS